MSQILQFFDEIECQQDSHFLIPIEIFLPFTFDSFHFHISLQDCHHFKVKDNKSGKLYQLKITCKMEPKYDNIDVSNQNIQQIKVHHNGQQMTLRNQDKAILNKLYSQLKMIISHDKFSEYFKPTKRLGRGAFATVYLIEHRVTKKQYAAKVFSRQGQKLQFKGHQALQNQIRTLRFLSHPNIIKYQGVYETENLIYLVTQYLSGGTLQDFMRNKCSLTAQLIEHIITDTLEALTYLENNHIMHRDLKPENILLRESDQKWVLADFGLSAFTNQKYLYDRCGTMGYMAPEVLAQNLSENQVQQPYNSACDLFSFGVICYNLIVGSLPFKVQSQGMFDKKIIWDAFTRSECKTIHPQIMNLLKGLMQKDPQKRMTPQQALKCSFFTNSSVRQHWQTFNTNRINQRYDKILRLANYN